MRNFIYIFSLTLGLVFSLQSNAQSFVGTIISSSGDVKILSKKGSGPYVQYEGEKFSYKKARIGRKVKPQEVIQCGPNGKAKIVYANGDHITIASGTSVILPYLNKGGEKNKGKSNLNLFYGKVRALVSKKGPRNNMKVKTPAAVAGVRGTDFFVSHNASNATQLTVIRGEVEVQKVVKNKVISKPVSVKSGHTAKVEAPPKKTQPNKAPEKIEVKEASKEKLLEVQKESTVKPVEVDKEKLTAEVKKEIKKLEEKSADAVLQDIKAEDPKMYEEIKKAEIKDATAISTQAVAKLYKEAPREEPKKKPSFEDVDALGDDVYNKYFKLEND